MEEHWPDAVKYSRANTSCLQKLQVHEFKKKIKILIKKHILTRFKLPLLVCSYVKVLFVDF